MKTVLLKRTKDVLEDGSPKIPTTEQVEYGEFAINYKSGLESLSFKNSDDQIVTISLNGNVKTVTEALALHEARNDNPHGVTKSQVGLENVDNTPDEEKPISIFQQQALDLKLNNGSNGGVANNLTTNSSEIALSAAMGIELNNRISEMTGGAIENLQQLEARVTAVEQEIREANEYVDSILLPKAQEIHNILTI